MEVVKEDFLCMFAKGVILQVADTNWLSWTTYLSSHNFIALADKICLPYNILRGAGKMQAKFIKLRIIVWTCRQRRRPLLNTFYLTLQSSKTLRNLEEGGAASDCWFESPNLVRLHDFNSADHTFASLTFSSAKASRSQRCHHQSTSNRQSDHRII